MLKDKYYKILNSLDEEQGAVFFDENTGFAKRIELTELLRANEFKMIEIQSEEYNKIQKKFDI